MRRGCSLRPFNSDWLIFKELERDWKVNLRGTGLRFDKTNAYKTMKQNNDGMRLFLILNEKL